MAPRIPQTIQSKLRDVFSVQYYLCWSRWNPYDLINTNRLKNDVHGISTWIYEFIPGNKTIYVVFDKESEFSGPRRPKLRPDQVVEDNVPYKHLEKNMFQDVFSPYWSFESVQWVFGYNLYIRGFWHNLYIRTRFSQVFGIICISGGYQDLLPGFYQVFTIISVGISMIQRGKPIRNLLDKINKA